MPPPSPIIHHSTEHNILGVRVGSLEAANISLAIPGNGRSLKTQQLQVLHTINRNFNNLQMMLLVRIEVFMVVTMKNASYGMLFHVALVRTDVSEERSTFLHSVRQLLVSANVLSSPVLVTLMMEMLHFSETSVLTIPEDSILDNVSYLILHSLSPSSGLEN
jgi:hypothetical protein